MADENPLSAGRLGGYSIVLDLQKWLIKEIGWLVILGTWNEPLRWIVQVGSKWDKGVLVEFIEYISEFAATMDVHGKRIATRVDPQCAELLLEIMHPIRHSVSAQWTLFSST